MPRNSHTLYTGTESQYLVFCDTLLKNSTFPDGVAQKLSAREKWKHQRLPRKLFRRV